MSSRFNPMAIESLLNDDSDQSGSEENKSSSIVPAQPRQARRNQRARVPSVQLPIRPPQPRAHRNSDLSPRTPPASFESNEHVASVQSPQQRSPPRSSRRSLTGRPHRPKYTEEEVYFIWYHRTDLAEGWDQVLMKFRIQFGYTREKSGLQCRFYRVLAAHDVEQVRVQRGTGRESSKDRIGAYGMVQRLPKRYEWMEPEHKNTLPLPEFRQDNPASHNVQYSRMLSTWWSSAHTDCNAAGRSVADD